MTLQLTPRAQRKADELAINPQIILEIDGVAKVFGVVGIQKIAQYGDPIFFGDPGLVYGGLADIPDELQSKTISLENSSTSINQQLRPDQGNVASVSSLQIALLDKDQEISKLVSPGVQLTDILARKCKVWMGFDQTAFPEDYIILFRGTVDDVSSGPGLITLNIAHPDTKKRQEIFQKQTTQLDGAINNTTTTVTVLDTTGFLTPVNGPGGSPDAAINYFVRIDNEIIKYTGTTGTGYTGVVRGQLGTVGAAHDDEAEVSSVVTVEASAMDTALKLMLSGVNGDFATSVPMTNFQNVEGDVIANALYFESVDVELEYGLTVGDYVTTTGAAVGANNFSGRQITAVLFGNNGTYIIVDGAALVTEGGTSAVVDFRSQYDTLGEGLRMTPDEVDIAQHTFLRDVFLSGVNYRFVLQDTLQTDDFLNKEIYLPAGAYALPRKGRSSVGFTSPPIPGEILKTFNQDNIKRPDRLTIRRTTSRNFYNTIVYAYEEDVLTDERFNEGLITTSATSKTQIPFGNKVFRIDSKGMRRDLGSGAQASSISSRLLFRYGFAADMMENVETFFKAGFNVEIGDDVILDGTDLKLLNRDDGTRDKPPKFFEVINKRTNIRTGQTSFTLVDTNFDGSQRFGLIGRASLITASLSTTEVQLKKSFNTSFLSEGDKWSDFVGETLIIRTEDGTSLDRRTLSAVEGNILRFAVPLTFTPVADDIVEFGDYNDVSDLVRARYTFMTDNAAFDDGGAPYQMI